MLTSGNEKLIRGLMESAPDAIVVVNRDGLIVVVNKGVENLFGYRREEIVGQPFEILMPLRFHGAHHSHRVNFFRQPEARSMGSDLELFAVHKDGQEFPVEISLSPVETDQGPLVSAAIRNVSLRLQHQQELKNANQELEAFTYTAANDLRAPLRHMHGFANLLHQAWYEKLDEEGRHFLDKILKASQEMGSLLDDLLKFSRISRVEMQPETIDLRQMVDRVRSELAPDVGDREITWDIGPLPSLQGDASIMHQVVVNLLSNAMKYTRKSPAARITIGSSEEHGVVTVFVQDNGAGFDMRYSDKLFQVFQRLHRAQDFEGTGIGLAIVRRVIERHGGRVWADATPNQGATFYFSLPMKGQANAQSRVHSAGG